MSAELWAQLTLGTYALVAAALMARDVRRCVDGPSVWLLYTVNRLYLGLGYHWRANRRCPYPADGPAIIIANHRSPVDPLLVWMGHHLPPHEGETSFRVIAFLTAREYVEFPGLVGWICRQMTCIPTERDGRDIASTREAVRRLKQGQLLGIFPEGRINTGQGLLPAIPGVAWLALTAKVPVYPVFIHNAPQGKTMVEPFYRFQPVRLTYGDQIDLSHYQGHRKTNRLLREVTELLMSRLAELGGVSCSEQIDETPAAIPFNRQTG